MSSNQARGGIVGVLIVICLALAGAGVVFDLAADAGPPFWIGSARGGGAALGAVSAVFAVLGAYAANAFGRGGAKASGEGSKDVRPDA